MAKANFLDCNKSRKGTGKLDCQVPDGVPTGFYLVPKGWSVPEATDFDTAFIKAQVKAKQMTPFLNAINFREENEEDVKFTTQSGVMLLVRNGKPYFGFDYDNGYGWHTAAYSYKSQGSFDLLPVFDNGVVFAAYASDGSIKGHSAGIVNPETYKLKNGNDPSMTMINIQLLNPDEYNNSGALLDPAANDFDVDAVPGIVDAVITKVSNAVADVVISVAAGANGAVNIEGIVAANLAVTGTAETITAVVYDAALKQYTITFSGDVSADFANIALSLVDTADNTNVIDINGTLYQGSTAA